jgi:hypothetical protein
MNWAGFEAWLSTATTAGIAGVLFALVLVAFVAGRVARGVVNSGASKEGDTFLISSVLGLLALMLSFTFALAADRFEARRIFVQQEANAIGTMYLRAQLLDEPHRSRISGILLSYTDNRIALASAPRERIPPLLEANDRLLTEFWNASAAAFPSIRGLDFSSTFFDSVNLVIDLDGSRKSARLARVPSEVFALLFLYVTASAAALGFTAIDRRAMSFTGLFLVLLLLFLLVIIDIDRPGDGGIRESQRPMERLRATLDRVAASQQNPR